MTCPVCEIREGREATTVSRAEMVSEMRYLKHQVDNARRQEEETRERNVFLACAVGETRKALTRLLMHDRRATDAAFEQDRDFAIATLKKAGVP